MSSKVGGLVETVQELNRCDWQMTALWLTEALVGKLSVSHWTFIKCYLLPECSPTLWLVLVSEASVLMMWQQSSHNYQDYNIIKTCSYQFLVQVHNPSPWSLINILFYNFFLSSGSANLFIKSFLKQLTLEAYKFQSIIYVIVKQVRNPCVYSRSGDRVWPQASQVLGHYWLPIGWAKGPPSLLLLLLYSANVNLTARLSALAVRKTLKTNQN